MLAVTALAVVVAAIMVWLAVSSYRASADADARRAESEAEARRARQDAETSRQALIELEASLVALDGKIAGALVLAERAKTKAEAEAAAKEVAALRRQQALDRAAIEKARHEEWLRKRREGIEVDDRCKSSSLC